MVGSRIDRRTLLAGLGAFTLIPQMGRADDVVRLEWDDLVPDNQPKLPPVLLGLIDHDQAPVSAEQPISYGMRHDWDGKTVALPGFVVPLDFSGDGVTAFILVPFAGACVHVPPPPANQLVLVTTDTPFETGGLFEPVTVTGQFGVSSISTHLADVGYAMAANQVAPYRV